LTKNGSGCILKDGIFLKYNKSEQKRVKRMNSQKKRLFLHFPRVGGRTIKTIISATLVAFVYGLIDRNPCFACIGAVFGMGNVFAGGLKSGGNRFLGTLIGGLFAIPFYWLMYFSGFPIPQWVWYMVGLFFVLYFSQVFGANGAIQPGTVVFFVVLATVSTDRFVSYTIARIIDTGIGVLVSLGISRLFPSPLDVEELNRKAAIAVEMAELASDGDMRTYEEVAAEFDFRDHLGRAK
jgi:uncharacterized membrane protein YgaE (UPF0421/DUF939 family)